MDQNFNPAFATKLQPLIGRLPTIIAVAMAILISPSPVLASQSICGETPTIYLDIGHTPRNFGSTSARGKPEYQFNIRLTRSISAALRRQGKYKVVTLNPKGKNIRLGNRAKAIRGIRSGILLSIHHDSVKERYLKSWVFRGKKRNYSDRYRGYSLFVSGRAPSYSQSRKLGEMLGRQFRRAGMHPSLHHAENIRGERRPLLNPTIGLYRFDNLAILKRARVPAVLIEAGIIINRQEENKLETLAFRNKITGAITRAVSSYCR